MKKHKTLSREDKARLLLKKARQQLETVKKAVTSGADDVAVTFLFQAYENSVRAATKSTGAFADTKAHWDLESQAVDLADQGYLESDVSERLQDLNTGRKQAAYGYEEDFEHSDFKEMIDELEGFMQRGGGAHQPRGQKAFRPMKTYDRSELEALARQGVRDIKVKTLPNVLKFLGFLNVYSTHG